MLVVFASEPVFQGQTAAIGVFKTLSGVFPLWGLKFENDEPLIRRIE